MRKPLWILMVLTFVGCSATRHAGQPCLDGENPWWTGCGTFTAEQQREREQAAAKAKAAYASITQTINPNSVTGCRSLGVVPGQNELPDAMLKAVDMGANTVLLGAQSTVTEGPYYTYTPGLATRPTYVTRTYVAMEAYVCSAASATASK